MSIQDQINRITNEVETQTDLIELIKQALGGKAIDKKEEEITLNFTENGTFEIFPEEGKTFSKLIINISV